MPAVQFRDPGDTIVTVSDSQGNVLFTADVLELNSLLAVAQREASTNGENWLRTFSVSLQRNYALAEAPTPFNCDKVARVVVDTLKRLKNEDGSTPTS